MRRACPQQRSGTGIDCSTRGEYVVDQHEVAAGNLRPVFEWDSEGPLNVVGALRSRPSDLL